ncbi:MAG: ABC transporter ATP-binding protein/permease [Bacilli bacterium]|nr:ABC transporter ATP-binding protein/permease [Bacilli bacterium]
MKALTPLKKYGFKVFLAPTLKLFEVVTELFSPFLVRYIIDEGIAKNDWNFTWKASLILFGVALLGFLFTMLAQYLCSRVACDYAHDLRKEVFHKVSSLSDKQLDSFGKEKILTIVNNDTFAMQSGVNMFMRLIFRPPFLFIGATILSFIIDIRAGFIYVGALIACAIVIGAVMAASNKKYTAIQASLDEMTLISGDALSGAKPVRAFNKEEHEETRFNVSVANYKHRNLDLASTNAWLNPLTFFFVNAALILVVYVGGFSGGENSGLTTGQIVSLISYLVSCLAAMIMFSRMIFALNKASASKKRIDSLLALEGDIKNTGIITKDEEASGTKLIEFKDVSLTYGKEGDKPAVSDLSFRIDQGETVGIIGGTGSGKSTAISLLLRLYEPTSGQILYRGIPLYEYDLNALRKEISVALQKPSIFKGTIRSNLLLSKKDATEDEMVKALKDALAYDYVSKYDDFLDHEIEEGGANLSGGQKQRLLIARALLKGGDLLILDDCMSALDYLSDQKVRSNISKIKGLTKIIVSQRASSLIDCDKILVFDNGQIIASGKHEELLKNCDIYREIFEIQKGGVR